MEFSDRFYERAPVGICYLDDKLRYLQINRWLANMNGVPVEAHIGRHLDEVIPHVAKAVRPVLQVVLDTGDPVIGGRVTAETPASPGEPHTFEHNYYPNPASNGKIVGVSCIVWDVTTHPEMSVGNMDCSSVIATAVSRFLAALDYAVSQYSGVAVETGSGPPRVLLPRDPASQLSPREHAVLLAFLSTASVDETAAWVDLSRRTVKNHLKSLFRKYQVSSQVELVCKVLGTLGEDIV